MSLYDYDKSQEISMRDPPFYALIMAAFRKADTINTEKLIAMWPDVWNELQERYNAPGGFLDTDEMKEGTDHEP